MIEFFLAFSSCPLLSGEPPELTGTTGACAGREFASMIMVKAITTAVKNNDMFFA